MPSVILPGECEIIYCDTPEDWWAARKDLVTASDISMLAWGKPKQWQQLRETKSGDSVRARVGNKYARWGHVREPELIKLAQTLQDDIEHNQDILVNGRFSATPDGLGDRIIVECKTTKYDFTDIPVDYYNQMQWQMLVDQSDRGLFIWEERLDNDRGWFKPGEWHYEWIEPNHRCQKELIEVAELFLSGGDPDW